MSNSGIAPCGNCGEPTCKRKVRRPDNSVTTTPYCGYCGFYRDKGEWIEYTDHCSKFNPNHSSYGKG